MSRMRPDPRKDRLERRLLEQLSGDRMENDRDRLHPLSGPPPDMRGDAPSKDSYVSPAGDSGTPRAVKRDYQQKPTQVQVVGCLQRNERAKDVLNQVAEAETEDRCLPFQKASLLLLSVSKTEGRPSTKRGSV